MREIARRARESALTRRNLADIQLHTGGAVATLERVNRVQRVVRATREFFREQQEIQERLLLLNRPWEEELLHWSADGELHGRFAPRTTKRRHSVTRGGWCPGCRFVPGD